VWWQGIIMLTEGSKPSQEERYMIGLDCAATTAPMFCGLFKMAKSVRCEVPLYLDRRRRRHGLQ